VINQKSIRLWSEGTALLSPSSLIDKFLDQIEELGRALLLVETDGPAREPIRLEVRID
jgi:hypothetical protein